MTRSAVLLAAFLAAAAAARQPSPQPDAAVLAGPAVRQARDARPTLVEYAYDGSVKRTEVAPEEAALRLLDLSPAERAAADAVLAERAAMLDRFVSDNLDLLLRLGAAAQGEDKAEKLRLIFQALRRTEPLRARGSLAHQLRDALEPAARRRFDALLAEYWDAVVAERRRAAPDGGGGRLAVLADERLKAFGREVERAFYRLADPAGEREFNDLLAAARLRPEQESRIRRMAEEFIVAARFRPTPDQERAFILRVTAMLDENQRRLLAQHVAQRERSPTARDRERSRPLPRRPG